MAGNFISDKHFIKLNAASNPLEIAEYENCIFKDCTFSQGDFGGILFSECSFLGCDLSMVNLANASFREVKFQDCKLLGLHFDQCNPFLFDVSFSHCNLNLASFYRLKMKKARFDSCNLRECDFSECDLSSAIFNESDLLDATFDNTILEKSDFRNARYYQIDPERNHIKKAKFSSDGLSGLLLKYDLEIE